MPKFIFPSSLRLALTNRIKPALSRVPRAQTYLERVQENMKETTRTSRTAGYLEKIFRALNADSFAEELEEPIISIMSTPGAYGHVTVGKVWKRKGEERHELNIAADWLQRPIEQVVATMIHEMVHLYNMQNGIQDCSRGNTYHNKKFKEEAEKHMLHIEKHDKYGWTLTSPTDELLEYIMEKGWEDIDMGRGCLFGLLGGKDTGKPGKGAQGGADGQEQPKKGSSRRYKCPQCKAIVRTTKDLHIICGSCNVDFELT